MALHFYHKQGADDQGRRQWAVYFELEDEIGEAQMIIRFIKNKPQLIQQGFPKSSKL